MLVYKLLIIRVFLLLLEGGFSADHPLKDIASSVVRQWPIRWMPMPCPLLSKESSDGLKTLIFSETKESGMHGKGRWGGGMETFFVLDCIGFMKKKTRRF
ncbi:MAG: hypothetical protein SPI18_04810 [Prevotella sp.]|nr:hypothetical protein [Prevotella sp.]